MRSINYQMRGCFLLLVTATTAMVVSPMRATADVRCSAPVLMAKGSQTKAQKLVMQRLNPLANIDQMDEAQLRKYAYAMQIELRRLIREEQAARTFRERMQALLDDAASPEGDSAAVSGIDVGNLIAAMKMEGLVRYGLAYATKATSWERVRKNHPELADFSDADLLATFEASGKGISGSFGDLF
jgi:hypothetical protein